MAREELGSGKITVHFKEASGLHETTIRCTAIEIYGEKLCFSDSDGDLIRKDGKILEVRLDNILQIRAK